jgi:hypothetical protein
VSPQRKEKHVVDLIKMVKRIVGFSKRQENKCRTKGQKSCGPTKERKTCS